MPDLGNTSKRDNDSGNDGSFGSPPDPIQDAAGDSGSPEPPAEPAGQERSSQESSQRQEGSAPETTGDDSNESADDLSLSNEVHTDTFEKFGKTYRMSEEDAGYSLWERFQDLKEGEDRSPNALDKAILDDLMMQGYYEREFEIGGSSFALRTVGPKTRHYSVHILQEMLEGQNLTAPMRNTLIVAEQLSLFKGQSTTGQVPSADFESKAAVEARIRFCQDLATPILDAIGSRVNAFRDRVETATTRSVSNF
jgi:hypothetical protein